MKYIFVVVGSLIVIGIVVLSLTVFNPKKEINDIKYFSYGTTDGMAMYDGIHYSIEYKDDKYIATIQKREQSEEDAKVVEISKDKVKKLENILNEYNVGSWDGFQKYDKDVLDGHSFSLSIRTFDDTSISASGYMRWPKNYREVRSKLENFFEKL